MGGNEMNSIGSLPECITLKLKYVTAESVLPLWNKPISEEVNKSSLGYDCGCGYDCYYGTYSLNSRFLNSNKQIFTGKRV